jgi:hypothetical protein
MNRLKTLIPATVVLLSSVLAAPRVYGFSGEIGKDERVPPYAGPKGMAAVANRFQRTYGYFGDAGISCSYDLYFTGDAKQLNAFLVDLAAVVEAPSLRLVLSPEPGEGRKQSVNFDEPDKEPEKFAYTWHLHVTRSIVFPIPEDDGDEEDVDGRDTDPADRAFDIGGVNRKQEKQEGGDWTVVVTVATAAGGIDVADLEIPLAYEAGVGGRLGRLADTHNQRRQWEAAKAELRKTRGPKLQKRFGLEPQTEPTREPDPNAGGLFDDSEEEEEAPPGKSQEKEKPDAPGDPRS